MRCRPSPRRQARSRDLHHRNPRHVRAVRPARHRVRQADQRARGDRRLPRDDARLIGVQYLAHLRCQVIDAVRLGEKVGAGVQRAVLDDGVARVTAPSAPLSARPRCRRAADRWIGLGLPAAGRLARDAHHAGDAVRVVGHGRVGERPPTLLAHTSRWRSSCMFVMVTLSPASAASTSQPISSHTWPHTSRKRAPVRPSRNRLPKIGR